MDEKHNQYQQQVNKIEPKIVSRVEKMEIEIRHEFEERISLEKKVGRKNEFLKKMKTLIQQEVDGINSD